MRRQLACARGDDLRPCIRPPEQRGQNQRLGRVDAVGILAEEAAAGGGDALKLSAEGCEVEVRFEDLVLRPAGFEGPRVANLPQLAEDRRPAACDGRVLPQERCELHRDRAASAAPPAKERVARSRRQRAQVDPAVRVEPPVLGEQDGADERRRDVAKRRPGETSNGRVDALLVEYGAAAVEEPRIGRAPRVAGLFEPRRPGAAASTKGDRRGSGSHRSRRDGADRHPAAHRTSTHGSTTIGEPGTSANISGTYIASTRAGGRPKVPSWVSATTYSVRSAPAGTHS